MMLIYQTHKAGPDAVGHKYEPSMLSFTVFTWNILSASSGMDHDVCSNSFQNLWFSWTSLMTHSQLNRCCLVEALLNEKSLSQVGHKLQIVGDMKFTCSLK